MVGRYREQLVNEEGNFDLDYDPKTINRLIRTLLNILISEFILDIQQLPLQIFLFIIKVKLTKRIRFISKRLYYRFTNTF